MLCDQRLFWCPVATVANSHTLVALNTANVSSNSSGGWTSKTGLVVSARLVPPGGFRGDPVPGLSSSWRCSRPLACGPFLAEPWPLPPWIPPVPPASLSPSQEHRVRGGFWEGATWPSGQTTRDLEALGGGLCPQAGSAVIRLLQPESPAPALVPSGGRWERGARLRCRHGGLRRQRWRRKGGRGQTAGLFRGQASEAVHGSWPGFPARWTRARSGGPDRGDRSLAKVPCSSGSSASLTESGRGFVVLCWGPSSASGPTAKRRT